MSDRHRAQDCPELGDLRAWLDASERDTPVGTHVAGCEACTQRARDLRQSADAAQQAMATLAPIAEVDVPAAFGRFHTRLVEQRMNGGARSATSGGFTMAEVWNRRSVRAAAAIAGVVALVFALTLSPMRTVADDFLNQFRVQKFAAVTIPMNMLEPLDSNMLEMLSDADKQAMLDELAELGTFDTTFSFDDLPAAVTVDDARAAYGTFDVPGDLPDGYDAAPNAYVTEAGSATATLNVAKARELLDRFNLPIYALDDVQAETITFSANVPAAVVLEYQNGEGERVLVGQMESPTLTFPDELDMNQLREEILRFPGLPSELVAQLRSIDNWETTLIIPIPEGADSEDVSVNGEAGLLIESAMGNAVLWQKDGKLFVVVGQVSADDVRDVADSMQ